jgi:hypothetical protein
MYEHFETGPLYEKAVQLMSTYRSLAARLQNARPRTQGKLDKQLIRLDERIGEALGELSDNERMALTCWRDGVIDGGYELDHEELTERPYVGIRRVERWIEEYSLDERKQIEDDDAASEVVMSSGLRGFLNQFD